MEILLSNDFQLPFIKILQKLHIHDIIILKSCSKYINNKIKTLFKTYIPLKQKYNEKFKFCLEYPSEKYSKCLEKDLLSHISYDEVCEIQKRLINISKISEKCSKYFIYSLQHKFDYYEYNEKVYEHELHKFRCFSFDDNEDIFKILGYVKTFKTKYNSNYIVEYSYNGNIEMYYGTINIAPILFLEPYYVINDEESIFYENDMNLDNWLPMDFANYYMGLEFLDPKNYYSDYKSNCYFDN